MLYSLVLALLFSLAISVPLEPGQAGGPWTKEEIGIVRAKVIFKNSSLVYNRQKFKKLIER